MKRLLIVSIAFCAALVSCEGTKSIKSFSGVDSLSYAFGIDIASQIRGVQDSSLNAAVIAAAIKDVFADKAVMTRDDAYAFLNEWFSVREPAKQQAESKAWLEEVKAGNPNIKTTASGLMYEILNPGDPNVKATEADEVMVNYALSLKDGNVIQQNDSIPFALNYVIPGWKEGMQLIGKGGEVVLWVPSEIGYGAQGSGPIPPNAALKFEIKLLDVMPASAAE